MFEFFNNVFTELSSGASLWFMLFHFIAFLIGLATGYFIWGRQLKQLKSTQKDLETRISKIENENSQLSTENEKQAETIETLSSELTTQKAKNKQLENEKGDLHSTMILAKARQQDAEKLIVQLNKEKDEIDDNYTKIITSLKEELVSQETKNKELETQKTDLDTSLIVAKTAKQDSEKLIAQLNKEKDELGEQHTKTIAALAALNEELATQKSKNEHLKTQKDDLNNALIVARTAKQNSEALVIGLTKAKSELEKEHNEAAAIQVTKNKELEKQINDLLHELSSEKASNEEADELIIQLTKEKDELEEEHSKIVVTLNEELATQKSKNKGLNTEKHNLNSALTAAKVAKEKDEKRINDLTKEKEEINATLGTKISTLEAEIERLKKEAAKNIPPVNKKLTRAEKAKLAKKATGEVKKLIGTAIPAAAYKDRDDLKTISGIGPFIEKKLNNLGIYTFEQISHFDDSFIEKVTAAIEFFPGRIHRDNWVAQAKKLFQRKND